jgi:hypothetical protein
MKREIGISLILIVLMSPVLATPAKAYNTILHPSDIGNTTITWSVVDAPEVPFSWWGPGFVFVGNWLADAGSKMTFEVTDIGATNSYLSGNLILGNLTIAANNTDIANNLILGISAMTLWAPGLAIPVGSTNIQALNQTAYDAAAKVPSDWNNGTLTSEYETITVGGIEYECIVWDYQQDPTGYGDPQATSLAYDLDTGVLVQCNSTYKFDCQYIFVLELDSIMPPQDLTMPLLFLAVGGLAVVVIVAVVIMKRK